MTSVKSFLDNFKSLYWPTLQPYALSMVRHGLTILSGYMIAKGVPGLQGSTIGDLSGFVVGSIGLGLSFLDKVQR